MESGYSGRSTSWWTTGSTSSPTRSSSIATASSSSPCSRCRRSIREHEPDAEGGVVPPRHRRSEEHTSELQSHSDLVCRLLLEKKKEILLHNSMSYSLRHVRTEIK